MQCIHTTHSSHFIEALLSSLIKSGTKEAVLSDLTQNRPLLPRPDRGHLSCRPSCRTRRWRGWCCWLAYVRWEPRCPLGCHLKPSQI